MSRDKERSRCEERRRSGSRERERRTSRGRGEERRSRSRDRERKTSRGRGKQRRSRSKDGEAWLPQRRETWRTSRSPRRGRGSQSPGLAKHNEQPEIHPEYPPPPPLPPGRAASSLTPGELSSTTVLYRSPGDPLEATTTTVQGEGRSTVAAVEACSFLPASPVAGLSKASSIINGHAAATAAVPRKPRAVALSFQEEMDEGLEGR